MYLWRSVISFILTGIRCHALLIHTSLSPSRKTVTTLRCCHFPPCKLHFYQENFGLSNSKTCHWLFLYSRAKVRSILDKECTGAYNAFAPWWWKRITRTPISRAQRRADFGPFWNWLFICYIVRMIHVDPNVESPRSFDGQHVSVVSMSQFDHGSVAEGLNY